MKSYLQEGKNKLPNTELMANSILFSSITFDLVMLQQAIEGGNTALFNQIIENTDFSIYHDVVLKLPNEKTIVESVALTNNYDLLGILFKNKNIRHNLFIQLSFLIDNGWNVEYLIGCLDYYNILDQFLTSSLGAKKVVYELFDKLDNNNLLHLIKKISFINNPEFINENGESLLHLACKNKENDIIFALLERGIEIELRDNSGRMALDYLGNYSQKKRKRKKRDTEVSVLEDKEIISKEEITLNQKFKHDYVDKDGNTILHILSFREDISQDVFTFFVSKFNDALINWQNKNKETILIILVRRENFKLAKIAFDHGAKFSIRDQFYNTPLDYLLEDKPFIDQEEYRWLLDLKNSLSKKLSNDEIKGSFLRLQTYVKEDLTLSSLRNHQQRAVSSFLNFFESGLEIYVYQSISGYFTMYTGSGKTEIFMALTHKLGLKTTIVVPTIVLIEQTISRLNKFAPGLKVESYKYGKKVNSATDVLVITYDSFESKFFSIDHAKESQLVILDEVHSSLSSLRSAVIDFIRMSSGRIILGFTATDNYGDSRRKKGSYSKVASLLHNKIFEYDSQDALLEKHAALVKINQFSFAPEMEEVAKLSGNSDNSLKSFLEKNYEEITESFIIQQNSDNQRAIIFIPNIELCILYKKALSQKLGENSVRAVHSKLSSQQRNINLQDHKDGKFQYLINVDVLTEGYDDKDLMMVFDLYPTKSSLALTQRFGRLTRVSSSLSEKKYFQLKLNRVDHILVKYDEHENKYVYKLASIFDFDQGLLAPGYVFDLEELPKKNDDSSSSFLFDMDVLEEEYKAWSSMPKEERLSKQNDKTLSSLTFDMDSLEEEAKGWSGESSSLDYDSGSLEKSNEESYLDSSQMLDHKKRRLNEDEEKSQGGESESINVNQNTNNVFSYYQTGITYDNPALVDSLIQGYQPRKSFADNSYNSTSIDKNLSNIIPLTSLNNNDSYLRIADSDCFEVISQKFKAEGIEEYDDLLMQYRHSSLNKYFYTDQASLTRFKLKDFANKSGKIISIKYFIGNIEEENYSGYSENFVPERDFSNEVIELSMDDNYCYSFIPTVLDELKILIESFEESNPYISLIPIEIGLVENAIHNINYYSM